MNELRWILIGFGFVVVAGIYLWGRRSGASPQAGEVAPARGRPEPRVSSFDAPPVDSDLREQIEPLSNAIEASAQAEMRSSLESSRMPRASYSAPPVLESPAELLEAEPEASSRARLEPSLGGSSRLSEATAELPVNPAVEAPTLSLSDSPTARRIERRKILSLRLSAGPTKLDGARLLDALKAESLVHGKYDVFHRLHSDGTSVFSVASMVEPGTFDLTKMQQSQYAGITMFAQLPGPVAGMYALNELVACAKRLQQNLTGTLQDDRGIPLTVHRIERMRQEVREFERPPGTPLSRGGSLSQSASP